MAFPQRPEVKAHPHAALVELEVPANLVRGTLRRVPGGNMGRGAIMNDDGVSMGHLDGSVRSRGTFLVPGGAAGQLLVDPPRKSIPVRVGVRSDELVERRVSKGLVVERVGHLLERWETTNVVDQGSRICAGNVSSASAAHL